MLFRMRHVLCFGWLLVALSSYGASYLMRLWQTEQGLPQNTVTAIAQTPDGYLWIGTQQGLARFDGARFVVFNSATDPAFKSDSISALLVDPDGGFWIGTEGGGVIRCRDGRFQSWSVQDGLSSDMVTSLASGADGTIWIGTVYGLNRYRGGQITAYTPAEGLPGAEVLTLATDGRGQPWVGTDQGLCLLAENAFKQADNQKVRVERVFVDRTGDLWAGSSAHGLLRARQGQNSLERVLSLGQVSALGPASPEGLWVGLATGGVQRVQSGTNSMIEHQRLEAPVTCVYEDREENVWVGTKGDGLARLTPRQLVTFTRKDGLPDDTINALMEAPDGQLWIGGHDGGISVLKDEQFVAVQMPDGVRNPSVLSLCAGPQGSVWIGTMGDGLFHWQDGRLTAASFGGISVPAVVTAIFVDREGATWLGTAAEGVIQLCGSIPRRYTTSEGLSRNEAVCITQTADGAIWLGTRGAGLNRIHQGSVSVFKQKDGLASDAIRALHADAQGMLWIGTSAGLSLFHKGQFFSYTRRHGLRDDIVSQVVSDDSGRLWLGCNRGLLRVTRQELIEVAEGSRGWVTCIPFGTQDGMLNCECLGGRQSAALKDRTGRLWFATQHGLVCVHSSAPPASARQPTVLLERVWLNEQQVVSDPITAESRILSALRVPPGNARLEFQYTATTFRSSEKTRFRYRLEGFDSEWVDASENRRALYSQLPAGEYCFRVVACNEEGVWNMEGASLGLIVLPHFWETAAFKIAAGLALIGAIGGLFWLRQSRRREVERLRLRIAGDLHDDLGSNLSSIALLSRRVRRQPSLDQASRVELNEIEQIARETTLAIRDIIWFIQPDRDTLADLVRRMQEVATVMLADIDCEFVAGTAFSSAQVSPDFRRNVFLAFKEAIHNVVRHAECSRVDIHVAMSGDEFSVKVRDNGRGFQLNSPPTGNGLKQMQLRMARLGGRCIVLSQPGEGTSVELLARARTKKAASCKSAA